MRPALAVLGVLLLGCQLGGELTSPKVCPATPPVCLGGATLSLPVAVSEAGAADLVLRLCKNEVCALRTPTPLPGQTPLRFACDVAGPLPIECQLVPNGAGMGAGYTLTLRFVGTSDELLPGDQYAVRVSPQTPPSSTPLLDEQYTVKTYHEERLAPEGCAPLCKTTVLAAGGS